jgi:hypothetical protein
MVWDPLGLFLPLRMAFQRLLFWATLIVACPQRENTTRRNAAQQPLFAILANTPS